MMISSKPFLVLALLATAAPAAAQIYRCEGPHGPVYTDRPCGPVVIIEDTSSGLGGQVSAATLLDLQARRTQREQRRQVSRMYDWRDDEIAAIDRQIANMEASKARSANNLAGATRSAGIDQQIAALRQARTDTVNSVQEQAVAAQDR